MLVVPFMSVTEFARWTKMGVRQVKKRMDIGEIPEVITGKVNSTRYVDLVALVRLMEAGDFVLSDLSDELAHWVAA